MQNTGLTEINGLKVNEARDKIMDILEQK